MTKRLAVLYAIRTMVQDAVGPFIQVVGLNNEGAAPDFIPKPELALTGRVVIRAGDPGTPDVDLSPPVYNYQHQVPLEISAYGQADGTATAEEQVDTLVATVAAAIKADRFLGGEVDYLDGFSPATDDLFVPGSEAARTADLVLVATYSTTDPL